MYPTVDTRANWRRFVDRVDAKPYQYSDGADMTIADKRIYYAATVISFVTLVLICFAIGILIGLA